jgi:hypothetical protein
MMGLPAERKRIDPTVAAAARYPTASDVSPEAEVKTGARVGIRRLRKDNVV